ncbi:MAG TPA: ROK family protein [Beijerinckiaceae bacterium]|nr:ROK family protein [Beijerinckiaceae bacterium]
MSAVGIDIGGTNVKLGLVDGTGAILARRRYPYAGFASFDDLAVALAEAVGVLGREAAQPVRGIGIAAPGHARDGDGVMVDGTANVPLLRGRSVAAALRDRLDLPTATVNDGTAAALGELRWGLGRGLDRFAVVTLGTGVGGGVVIHGRVVTGSEGEPPEIGAMVLDAEAGAKGTLEALACAAGFSEAYARAGGSAGVPPEAIFARAEAGEPAALTALDAVCRRIAQACGTMINLVNLQACLIGGGIAAAGEPLRSRVEAHLPAFTWPYLLARTRIDLARTGPDAGILGAAARVLAPEGR